MALPVKKENGFTYKDYLSWPDDERWEIIEGRAYSMSPAPKPRHQRVLWNLVQIFAQHRDKLKNCTPFIAPTDVVFDERNVVQPDLFIVCDEKKITEDYIQGPPDLVIEIVSPSTEVKDKREKRLLYERFGVKEYLIVNPEPDRAYVEVFTLNQGAYGAPQIFNWDEVLKLQSFDLEIPLWEVFEKLPPAEDNSRSV